MGLRRWQPGSPSKAAKPSPTSTIQKLNVSEIGACGRLPSMMACRISLPVLPAI
jgi:hypothetical protein